jgi:poly-gamma-glutamate capsule biosynthesis protein CapA/YwtB (metallophosphatase superfamily)
MNILLLGDIWAIDTQVKLQLPQADYYIANLETPITDLSSSAIRKTGPKIKGSFQSLQNIVSQFKGKLILTLANNHIMDYGQEGLYNTIDACKKLNIVTIGIENNDRNTTKVHKVEINNKKIAVLAIAEHQFGYANKNRIGYSALDDTVFSEIRRLKQSNDFVIVSTHAGIEMSPLPSPEWRKTYREFITAGADIVHGHHAHVPQVTESYEQGYIYYGLGNAIVNPEKWKSRKMFSHSLAVEIIFSDKLEVKEHLMQLKVQNNSVVLSKLQGADLDKASETLRSINSLFLDKSKYEKVWQELCFALVDGFYLKGYKKATKKSFKKITKSFFKNDHTNWNEKRMLSLYSIMNCESHRHVILRYLSLKLGLEEDLRDKESKTIVAKLLEQ